MEIQKKRFKGSFLSFFDWNGKSQKKLLCDRPNLPDVSKQGKENMDSMPKSQDNRIKMDNNRVNPSNNASCDIDCAISINSDEGCGAKVPGLVARLMGLDSLPVSTVSGLSSSSTSLYGSNSLGSSHSPDDDVLHSMVDCCCPVDPINMRLKPEKSSWAAMQSRAQKVGNPAMKRFQTEMLPPKSVKPIPVTHNKLLSPIKSPGYTQPKHAAHVMEAAAKIIEASSQPCRRNRMSSSGSSSGSSSVPLRILDLKEKLEAAQYEFKFMDMHTANPLNGKPSERRNNLYKSSSSFKGSRDSVKNSSCQLASKGKSASLAMPSKTNAQSRDELTLNGNRRYMRQNKQNDVKSNKFPRSQKKQIVDRARVMQQRACTGQSSNVLGKNNQKQNSVTNKGGSASKVDSNKPTQTWSSESSTGAKKTTKKVVVNANIEPKRFGTRITDTIKEFPVSKRKGIFQKKNYSSSDVHNEARGSNSAANTYENKSVKCNITTDRSIDQDAFSMKGSNGVISFTFTSPLRRNMPELQSSTEQVMGTRNEIEVNSCSTIYSSMQDEEVSNFSPMNESLSLENKAEWSEQSSSIVMGDNMASEQLSLMSNSAEYTRSARNMELEYVKDIFSNAELMAEEFVVGETDKIIMENLFDKLENEGLGAENYEEYSKIERKIIFDTVSECLELRCKQVFVGSCKAWPKWVASVQRKKCLAEEFYKEMLSFRNMEDGVEVDELVSKDMSTGWGRWLDFDIEACEEGSELEFDIVTCLINELVSDLLYV
ncbi:hypothetical protein glysoja_023836 [Glycine soja]|nr:hypothetical protein glysoja_023836 [Glycine soja]